jgi:hypothetical protein
MDLSKFNQLKISEIEFANLQNWESDIEIWDGSTDTESKYITKMRDGLLILSIWQIASGDLGGEFIGEHPKRFILTNKNN